MLDIITLVSNLGALTAIGFIYFAYIKNLRSVNKLKDQQLKISDQNVKLWKDRALELERKTPEFIEKQLNERIKIREDEVERLKTDYEEHKDTIEQKNSELKRLHSLVDSTQDVMSSLSVYDSVERDFVEVPYSQLEVEYVGAVSVDAACLMVGDPWYLKMDSEIERSDMPKYKRKFEIVETKEQFCADSDDDTWPAESFSLDSEHSSVGELLKRGMIKEIPYDGTWPAIAGTYIKGNFREESPMYNPIRHHTFINGSGGAGVSISLAGDGVYYVKTESYKGEIQRIVIDI